MTAGAPTDDDGPGTLSSDTASTLGFNPTAADGPLSRGRFGENDNNSHLAIDFGFFIPMSLGNRVFRDDGTGGGIYNNGIMDGGELPVANVRVELYGDANTDGVPDGALLAFDTTDAGGYYLFDDLAAGSYVVVLPASNFTGAGPLVGYNTSTPTGTETTGVAGNPYTPKTDRDDNGLNVGTVPSTGGVRSGTITLSLSSEPTGETELSGQADPGAPANLLFSPTGWDGPLSRGRWEESDINSNLTVDFGFIPVFALGNRDPFSKANVLSRGIVGDLKGELVVASPVYKQHFSLRTGRCVEDAAVEVPVYRATVEDGFVLLDLPPAEVATVCSYCGVGCGVIASVEGNRIAEVRGDPAHPANRGRLCSKGMSLHGADPAFRGLYPEIRGERATWDEALEHCASRFREIIQAHGPDAVAFYISGQLLTEDYYVFNKLAKGLIGTNNVDTNSRLCMASAVAGYKQTLGADAPPACYDDIDQAECVFIAGSNTAWAHPILFRRLEAARPRHLVVVDPRRTETARAATLHLQIVPGTDVALFSGMLHVMRREGWIDEEFIAERTEGFAHVPDLPAVEAAAICGVAQKDLEEAAWLFAGSRATLSLYCQGLNQSSSGTAKNAALINLHLAAGQIGRPGAGPLSLTGQPNAMGGREVGGMANLLSAHRDLSNATHRAEIAALKAEMKALQAQYPELTEAVIKIGAARENAAVLLRTTFVAGLGFAAAARNCPRHRSGYLNSEPSQRLAHSPSGSRLLHWGMRYFVREGIACSNAHAAARTSATPAR